MFNSLVQEKESKPVTELKSAKPPDLAPTFRAGIATAGRIQTKTAIGSVNDPLETEADRIAEQVLRAPEASGRKEAGDTANSVQQPQGASAAAGRPLDGGMRAFFEPRFGYDFSKVRIYSDEQAAESARSIGALAYTMGSNIAFDSGRYRPETGEGRRLLAHELTHVVQQGHATSITGKGLNIAAGRTTPMIQRDTPNSPTQQPGATSQGGPLSVTKRVELEVVSRQEVTQALTDFLYSEQAAQGGQTLHITDNVRWAVRKLFPDVAGSMRIEGFLGRSALPGSAPEFAAAVTKLLPDFIPRSRITHLGVQPSKTPADAGPKSFGDVAGHVVVDSTVGPIVKKLPIPKDWQDKIIDGARGAVADGLLSILDQSMSGSPLSDKDKGAIHSAVEALIKQKAGTPMDRQQEGAGSPYAPVQPPSTSSSIGSVQAPGEHIFNLPKIPWDIPTRPIPKPNLPQPPLASESQAIDKIIQGLDDTSLVPAAAKGTPQAGDYASAKDLARNVANLLAAADKKKQYTVELTIGMNYRHVEDLADIFDKISDIVRQIAAALPGGAANVGEVIITPARAGKDDKIPARRIVKLHSGN
jgi:hypothetical protein